MSRSSATTTSALIAPDREQVEARIIHRTIEIFDKGSCIAKPSHALTGATAIRQFAEQMPQLASARRGVDAGRG